MNEKRDFDRAASSWDEEPRRVKLAGNVAAAIIDTIHPARTMDVLDFGCGTGLITLLLQPQVKSIIGVDSSQGMLNVLEQKVREHGLENVATVFCDFERGDRPYGHFHLIVSSMTLHHVRDLLQLFQLFNELLLPGGVLCLADLDAEDGSFHDDPTGVHHHGFDRKRLMVLLARAGFVECSAKTADVIVKGAAPDIRQYPVFLITANKPA
jgi:ubiquinone/menaquinone biosynthesis C-methylase UbiE